MATKAISTFFISFHSEISDCWLETQLTAIDYLPKEIIKDDLLHVAVAMGQLTQPVQSRLACSRSALWSKIEKKKQNE